MENEVRDLIAREGCRLKERKSPKPTFIIASLTLVLVINPFLYKLSINSAFVSPEHRQAMFRLDFDVPLTERKKERIECRLGV
jgi:hypothetical protein